jgi:thiosulfate reductase cytochrome b subunit
MPVHTRFQHALVLGSVFVLAVTGLPQKLTSFGPSEWLMNSAGGIETLRSLHHAAGAVLIVTLVYHLSRVLFAALADRDATLFSMVPDARDYGDAIAMLLYFGGLRRERPMLREPTYFQKLDYWVLAWGLAAMALTGLARLFPATATRILPGDVVAAALEAHSDLAVLAVVWVAVVHVAYCTLLPYSSAGSSHPAATSRSAPHESSAGGED